MLVFYYDCSGYLSGLYFMPRSGWGAVPPNGDIDPLLRPTPNIVYTHTADISMCSVTEECCNQVRNIQYLHMNDEKPESKCIYKRSLIYRERHRQRQTETGRKIQRERERQREMK